jgi:hypothetical protein
VGALTASTRVDILGDDDSTSPGAFGHPRGKMATARQRARLRTRPCLARSIEGMGSHDRRRPGERLEHGDSRGR